MSGRQHDENAPITLISSTGERKGAVPTRSGPHGKEALRASASAEGAPAGSHADALPMSPFPDDHGHVSGPNAKKKLRPEVEAWAQELNTDEHKLATLRQQATPPPSSAMDAIGIADSAPAAASEPAPTPSWDGVEPPQVEMGAPAKAAKPKRELPSIGTMVTIGALVVGVGVGGFLAYKVATAPKSAPVEVKPAEEDEFVRRMRAQAEGAPECWTTDSGFDFTYRGPKGELLRADRIADVPHLYRRSASCVRER